MVMDTWDRLGVRQFALPGGHVEVYRRDDRLVHGVCMSLYVAGQELMRFDFPAGKPHRHWGVGDRDRLYYPRDWPLDRLFDLAVQELADHAKPAAKLAGLTPVPNRYMKAAAAWARTQLTELAEADEDGISGNARRSQVVETPDPSVSQERTRVGRSGPRRTHRRRF